MAISSLRSVRALFLGLVASAALVVGVLGGAGGADPAAAEKKESRYECREDRVGGDEWREHHCSSTPATGPSKGSKGHHRAERGPRDHDAHPDDNTADERGDGRADAAEERADIRADARGE